MNQKEKNKKTFELAEKQINEQNGKVVAIMYTTADGYDNVIFGDGVKLADYLRATRKTVEVIQKNMK